MADPLDGLSPAACGFVLAAAMGGAAAPGADADATAGLLSGPDAAACRTALTALKAQSREERARGLARLLARVAEPVPPGIERVHPGWLRAALEGEATEILLAITAGLPREVAAVAEEIVAARVDAGQPSPAPASIDAESLAELRRAVFAPFAAMPSAGELAELPGGAEWQRLMMLPAERLTAELARRGAEVLGVSLAGAPSAVVARAAARVGKRSAPALLLAARRTPASGERDRARALVAAATVALEQTSHAALDDGAAVAIGLLDLAERLASASRESVHALAQRLPPALGQTLLAGHARVAACGPRAGA